VLAFGCAPAVFPKGVLARARVRLGLDWEGWTCARAARARGRPTLRRAKAIAEMGK